MDSVQISFWAIVLESNPNALDELFTILPFMQEINSVFISLIGLIKFTQISSIFFYFIKKIKIISFKKNKKKIQLFIWANQIINQFRFLIESRYISSSSIEF
jgi:hypothetical protein